MRALIIGGGVVGTCLAYRLAVRGAAVTVIERHGIAGAASGKSGGFLARDWCDGTPLMELAQRSFACHAELADDLGNDWGYRRLTTFSGTLDASRLARPGESGPAWLSASVHIDAELGSTDTTAQVHPAAFTAAMMRAAAARGATLRSGDVTGLRRRGERVVGVELGRETLEGDVAIIAMGPWSLAGTRWLPLPPVYGLKGHSLVFATGERIPPHALFLEARDPDGSVVSPEIFPRADGTTYACGVSSDPPLPLDPAHVRPDNGAVERLEALCRRVSPILADAKVLARQACYRPITQDGLPLIGAVPGTPGAFVATGHSVWGILNAPATAEALSELILDGEARTVDLAPFDPARLPALDPAHLATRRASRSRSGE